ncbi:MAG: amidophosphoribosyltransferase [Bernardetiaceae bacterium]
MCGIAFVRLRKPLSYFYEKYDNPAYAINKLFLLMEKQHNRGQDGAGIAGIRLDVQPGTEYIDRLRSIRERPIAEIFEKVGRGFDTAYRQNPEHYHDPNWMKANVPFSGETLIGHLRYGTYGSNDEQYCHPMGRKSNWRTRNLMVAGNFNMTNNDELFDKLVQMGQQPKERIDTLTVMEEIGHFLDVEFDRLWQLYKGQFADKQRLIRQIEEKFDLPRVLRQTFESFDGGYAIVGLTGYGGGFLARDPAGIRPAYYYADEEIVVAASEKPAIKTTFDIDYDQIQELPPAHALVVDKFGNFTIERITEELPQQSCSFERIYFSRGSDPEIYRERKMLGRLIAKDVLSEVQHDLTNTVFSYIPNTAETAFLGMIQEIEDRIISHRQSALKSDPDHQGDHLLETLQLRPRVEKLVIKDTKIRTFITEDKSRNNFVAHVYDTTYEIIRKGVDTLVVIDDSIVRGTTLEQSILQMLDRLGPRRIIVVSSAPQIRYPDCYGIDMSKMYSFIAFRAVLALMESHHLNHLIEEVYHQCKEALRHNAPEMPNYVQQIYAPFTDQEVADKIAELVSRRGKLKAEVKIIFQSIENLHQACPHHKGDWYFTGNYPTPGGNRIANQAFVNWREGRQGRAY